MFALRQKDKNEGKYFLQGLVKLLMNALYGIQIRKDFDKIFKCKSAHLMQTEYDDNVLESSKIPNVVCIGKRKKDNGLAGDIDVKKTLPFRLGAFSK